MKAFLVVLAALVITGCSSGWKGYSDEHNCQATEKTLRKPVVNSFSTTSLSGPNQVPTISGPSLDLRYESYRLYKCDNGSIWGPISADGKE